MIRSSQARSAVFLLTRGGFVGQESPLMAALFDTTEESRENKRCAGKGQKQTCRNAIQNQDGIVSGNGDIK